MVRRHDALIPLTHDHHHALAHVRRLKEAKGSQDPASLRRAADDFLNFYLGRSRHHFHEEEELFFAPLVDHDSVREHIVRAVTEHLRLHALVQQLRRQLSSGDIESDTLGSIAELLEGHVRFEEQQLFPLIEELIPQEELMDLASAGRRDV